MICPRCNTNLVIAITKGIEIDHCPNCRGVWLDRGELEKIIERSNNFESSYHRGNERYGHHDEHHDKHHDDHYERPHDNQFGFGHNGYGNQQRHRKGFFSELFDF